MKRRIFEVVIERGVVHEHRVIAQEVRGRNTSARVGGRRGYIVDFDRDADLGRALEDVIRGAMSGGDEEQGE